MSMTQAAARRGRDPRRDADAQTEPAPKSSAMGIAQSTTPKPKARQSPATDFSHDDDSSLRPIGGGKAKGKGKSDKGKGKSAKGKGKGDKGGGKQGGGRSSGPTGDRTRSPVNRKS